MQTVDCRTIQNKVLCTYQGWFTVEGDGMQCAWRHWFHSKTDFEPAFDVWPDTSEMSSEELFSSPLLMADGKQAMLFSSCHAGIHVKLCRSRRHSKDSDNDLCLMFSGIVDRHLKWMADYGIHGLFLQRFVCELEDPKLRYARDVVANRVRLSAEKHGRCFAVMYDVAGSFTATACAGLHT